MLQLVNRYEPLVMHLSQLRTYCIPSGCTQNCSRLRGLTDIPPDTRRPGDYRSQPRRSCLLFTPLIH